MALAETHLMNSRGQKTVHFLIRLHTAMSGQSLAYLVHVSSLTGTTVGIIRSSATSELIPTTM
jgi:hypothetical protein